MATKTAIITGANIGLGFECAKTILKESEDYYIVFACRNRSRTQVALDELAAYSERIEFMELDLNSQNSVREFVRLFKVNET